MIQRVKCKICGHEGDDHHPNVSGPVLCGRCPSGRCQDGPDGRRYREALDAEASQPYVD